jgi:SsrA-binding protein
MKTIARNRKAFHDYDILDKFVAGIELKGTEVKSLRAGKANLLDSYAHCQQGEIFILHMHISPFEHGNLFNHDPYRKRKLLFHRKQIDKLCSEVSKKQLTLVPLSLFFDRQWVKVEIGLCKGRKKYDKRQKIAAEESKRRLKKVMKSFKG